MEENNFEAKPENKNDESQKIKEATGVAATASGDGAGGAGILSSLLDNKVFLSLVVAGIAVIAGYYRSFLLANPLFYSSDELYHYSVARLGVENGYIIPNVFQLSGYPNGTLVTEPKGLYYLPIFIYFFLKGFVSLMDVMRMLPLVFGMLYIFALYFVLTKIFDKKVTILALVLIAANMANASKTSALIYRGDAFMPLFFLIVIYLLWLYFETKKAVYSLLSGFFLGVCSLIWNGSTFGYLTIALGFILINLKEFFADEEVNVKENAVAFSSLVVGYAFYLLYRALNLIYEQPFMHAFPLVILMLFALLLVTKRLEKLPKKEKAAFILGSGIAVAAVGWIFFSDEIIGAITGYGMVKATNPLAVTIAELQAPKLENFFGNFGYFFIFLLIGIVAWVLQVLKRAMSKHEQETIRAKKELIWLGFFLTSFYLATQSLRFASLLSYTAVSIEAYGFFEFISIISKRLKLSKKMSNFIAADLIIILLADYYMTNYYALHGGNLIYNSYWGQAMEWFGRNSPPNAGVIIWWNEGTMVEALAHRGAYIDSVGAQNSERITLFSELMLENGYNSSLFKNFKNNGPVYLMTSPTWMWQIHNWLTMTGKNESKYGFALLNSFNVINNTAVLLNFEGNYKVIFDMNKTETAAYINNKRVKLSLVLTDFTQSYYKDFNSSLVVILTYQNTNITGGFLITRKLFETNYIKLQFICGFQNCDYPYTLIYANPMVKIFKVDESAFK